MLRNRRLDNIKYIIYKFDLVATKPPEDSLFFKMWNASEPIGLAAYELPFLQGIKGGDLDPNK